MKLSSNGKMLALALGSDKHQKPRIQVHDVENDENAFKLICFIDNILNHIEYIDISKDNYFLMFKDAMEEVVYMNLTSFKKENYIAIEYDVEWLGDGIKFSDQTRGIEQFYSIENQSLKVVKLSNKTMAVTDEMGTVAISPVFLARSDCSTTPTRVRATSSCVATRTTSTTSPRPSSPPTRRLSSPTA